MPPLFSNLILLRETAPGAPAWNMARDETLLRQASAPILRIYGWREKAVSFGCFERYEAVAQAHPERVPVRRWTGGGVVLHGEDFTYSLIVPASDPLAKMRALESYERIHAGVAAALAKVGFAAQLADSPTPKISTACFENAVASDVIEQGRKIAGAAQRRTRDGLLHQGGVQLADLPAEFGIRLAETLGARIHALERDEELEARATQLVAEKYGTRAWLEKY